MRKSFGLSALSLTLLTYGGCANSPKSPFDPKEIAAAQAGYASENVRKELSPLPQSLERVSRTNPPKISGPEIILSNTVNLTLAEVIHRAVVNNLEVRVESYQSAIDRARILEAEANFDPKWVNSVQHQHQYVQGTIYSSMSPPELYSTVLSTGIKQNNDLGGSYSIMLQNTKHRWFTQSQLSTAFIEEKSWDEQVVLQITQPLLKDFGQDVNRARITIARNDQKISQLDLQRKLEETIQKVEETYWRLVQACEDVRSQEDLLKMAETTLDATLKRELKGAHDVQINHARSNVESRKLELIKSRNLRQSLSISLKGLMNDPDYPVAGATLILPADKPVAVPVQLNLADQVETAMANRVELIQQSLRIDSARVVIKAAQNNLLPKLDITASVGYEGIGTTWGESWDDFNDGHTINWGVGFQFEVPIGNRAAEAIWKRTQYQHYQSLDEWRRAAEQIAGEVVLALHAVEEAWETSVAAQNAVYAAQDAIKALENFKDKGGVGDPAEGKMDFTTYLLTMLDRQTALSQAESALNASLASYNQSLSELEKAKGTILKYNSIEMREGAPAQLSKK